MSGLKIFGTGTPCFNCSRKMPKKTEDRMEKIRESYETPVWLMVGLNFMLWRRKEQ